MRYIGDGRPFDAARASTAIDEEVFAKCEADASFYIRAIHVGDQYAGHAEFFRRPGRSEYEMVYLLLPQFWGHGIGSCVVDLLLNEARARNLPSVIATVHPGNAASIVILTRRGFAYDSQLTAELGFPAYRLKLQ